MSYYLASPRCTKCSGTGIVESLTLCCGPVHPALKDCACDADGYMLDEVKPCECLREVTITASRAYEWCPHCNGWGQYTVVASNEGPATIVYEPMVAHCEMCRGTGYRGKKHA